MRSLPTVAVLVCALALTALARAEGGIIFRWVDKEGNLHATDTLADVPEPYYSLYAAKLRAIEEARANGAKDPEKAVPPPPSTPPVTPPPPKAGLSPSEQQAIARKHWKDLVAYWRGQLAAATDALAAAEEELGRLRQNPVLRETPQVRAQIAAAKKHRDEVKERLEHARHMLEVELPARAKREGVPPRWLL